MTAIYANEPSLITFQDSFVLDGSVSSQVDPDKRPTICGLVETFQS